MTRRLLLTLGLLACLAAPAAGQVAYSTSGSGKNVSGAVSTITIASVDCSGANVACYWTLEWRDPADNITFTSVTHPSSSSTTLTSRTCRVAGNSGCMVTGYICNGGGSGNLVGTISANANLFFSYIKLTGVDCAGTPVGTTTLSESSGGTATTVTTNVTTTANGMAVDSLMIRDEGTTNIPTVGQTQRTTQSDAGSMGLFTSTKPDTATSLGWTWTVEGSLNYVHSVTPFNAAAAGGGSIDRGLLLRGCCEMGPDQ